MGWSLGYSAAGSRKRGKEGTAKVRTKKLIKARSFLQKPVLRLLIIGFLFVTAFGLRLYHIDEPPMDFQEVRQYHSALLARGFYEELVFGESESAPPDGIIEPPIIELVASFAYYTFGGEYLWVPRLLSAVFWMVGGAFLYLIAKKITSPGAAVFSLFFYLFVPFSVLPSRAFMPDPLMIMMLLISIFTILRYHEQPSKRRLVIAATASSLAVLTKPGICFFQIFGAFISLAIYREGIRRSLTSLHLLIFAALSLLPVGLYYLYGTFIGEFLQGQVQDKVVPGLLLREAFWIDWLDKIKVVVGYFALVGALLGVLLARAGSPRALMIGLWVGYFLFGLVFTFHIKSHDYYSLQLIPVVALSLGPIGALVMGYLGQMDWRSYGRLAVLGLFFLAVALSVVEYRHTILGIVQQAQGGAFPGRYVGQTTTADYEARAKAYQEIGEVVDHSPRTLFLAPEFGYSLMYHGRLSGEYWPPPGRRKQPRGSQPGTEERFNALYSEHSPEYFIVIPRFTERDRRADFWESEEYKDLRDLLTENFSAVVEDDDYVVFDLRKKD